MDKKTFISEILKEVTLTQLSKKRFPLDGDDLDELSSGMKSVAKMLNDTWKEIFDTDAK